MSRSFSSSNQVRVRKHNPQLHKLCGCASAHDEPLAGLGPGLSAMISPQGGGCMGSKNTGAPEHVQVLNSYQVRSQ
jgi:hypothetical protein